MRQYWYLTKGSLGKKGPFKGLDVRAFSKPPAEGPYITMDYDRKNEHMIFKDEAGNLLRKYDTVELGGDKYSDHPYKYDASMGYGPEHNARNDPYIQEIAHRLLNKMRFERGYVQRDEMFEGEPHRMMSEYVDRKKKKTAKPKPKRKVTKKKTKSCGCK